MISTGINLGKAAVAAGMNALRKLAAARAGTQVAEKAVEKTVELLGAGEVVAKIAEVASQVSTSSPETADSAETVEPAEMPEPSTPVEPAPVEPETSPEPPTVLMPLEEKPLTLTRVLPDGDNDNGKGWQCSKYAWYLATGVRMNYAPHPDYGPCHGAGMVDYLITNLGWHECEKKNGAIFASNDDSFGHTGVVLDAASNLVNDANTLARPMQVDTHQIDLDSLGTRYAEPLP